MTIVGAGGAGDAGAQQPAQRHAAVDDHLGVELDRPATDERRHVLDRELDSGQLGGPAALELFDRVEDQLVELLAAGPVARDDPRGQLAAQPAPATIAVRTAPGAAPGRRGLTHAREPTARRATRPRRRSTQKPGERGRPGARVRT